MEGAEEEEGFEEEAGIEFPLKPKGIFLVCLHRISLFGEPVFEDSMNNTCTRKSSTEIAQYTRSTSLKMIWFQTCSAIKDSTHSPILFYLMVGRVPKLSFYAFVSMKFCISQYISYQFRPPMLNSKRCNF